MEFITSLSTELWFTVVMLVVGLICIIKGGDWFVDGASWLAEVSGIPKLIVGATVVSLATTLPELLVSSFAAVQGNVDMAIGNAVGSVTANVGLIMGISLLFMPVIIKRSDYLFKSLMMLAAAFLIGVFGILFNEIALVPAIAIFIIFFLYLFENITSAKKALKSRAEEKRKIVGGGKEIAKNIAMLIIGAVGIVVGAQLLVKFGTQLATTLGVSQRIISLTIIAIGTSLPELVTTITAIVKKQSALSVGNIIGANILDLTLIMPICSIISGGTLPFPSRGYAFIDVPVCFALCFIGTVPMLIKKKFSRWQGIALLVVYIAYMVTICTVSF